MRYEQFSVNELTVNKLLNPYGSNITPGANPSGAMDYFVDLNTTNGTKDGLSWDTAFDTIAEAITASNTSIGLSANRWWARRNRIFVLGDGIAESLTILPEKCDVIGLGSDLYPFPRVTGVHVIAATRPTAGKASACRFINMGFQASGTAEIFKVPAACHGIAFIGCEFTSSAAGNTKALAITDCAGVRIIGCNFQPGAGVATTGLFGLGIGIEGTSSIHDLYIAYNRIFATAGINIAAGDLNGSVVEKNIIRSMGSGKACVDSSNEVAFVDNRIMTAINDLAVANSCTWNAAIAVGNLINTAQARSGEIPIKVVMTS